jgi:hypothetical protein
MRGLATCLMGAAVCARWSRRRTRMSFTLSGSRRSSGYAWRLVRYSPSGPDAIIAPERGAFKTIAATLRYDRRLGFHRFAPASS